MGSQRGIIDELKQWFTRVKSHPDTPPLSTSFNVLLKNHWIFSFSVHLSPLVSVCLPRSPPLMCPLTYLRASALGFSSSLPFSFSLPLPFCPLFLLPFSCLSVLSVLTLPLTLPASGQTYTQLGFIVVTEEIL